MSLVVNPFSGFEVRVGNAAESSTWNAGENAAGRRGFTLVELLVVVAIISILTSLLLLSVQGTKSSRDLANAAYSIQGALEQARTLAMATSTYTWVGFFEENPASPGTAGIGQVVIAVVASANGTNLDTVGSPTAQLSPTGLTQVTKVLKIPNLHLTVLNAAAVPTRTTVPVATYQVASPSFANTTTFPFPLTGTAQYNFTQIIQFSPQGDATRIADYPTPLIEIGLQPSHGNSLGATGANFAAIQVSGIGGQVITYRP
jgi:prepilin-type N-terminal cleavage/methylation domain-containing protein